MDKESSSDWRVLASIGAGFLLSGLVHAVIGLPLSYIAATAAGRDPFASILLLRSGEDLASLYARPSLLDMSYAEASTLSGFLAFYGALVVALPLIYMIVRRDGFVRFLTLTYGMYLGLLLASAWFRWSNTGTVDWFAPTTLEIAYIYLAFLVAEAAKLIVEDWDLSALPYTYAIDGAFGTVSVLIIHVGYDPSFASLLLGPFFLIAVALAILLSEWIILRPATILFAGIGLAVDDPALERWLGRAGPPDRRRKKVLIGRFRRKIAEAAGLSYVRRTKLIETTLSKAVGRMPRRRGRQRRARLDWRLVALACVGNLLFPFVGIAFAWLLF